MDLNKLLQDVNSAISALNKVKTAIASELQPKLFTLEETPPDTKAEDGEKVATVCYKKLQYEFDALHTFMKETKFIWSPKENKAIKDIVTKIKIVLTNADLPFTVENVSTSFNLLVKDIEKVDEFTAKNFSPSMINSRFNTIVSNLKVLTKKEYKDELKEKLTEDKDWLS